jgi:hypothetical protein
VAGLARLRRLEMRRRFANALERRSVVAARASRCDANMIHLRAGERHGAGMASFTRLRRLKMIGYFALCCSSVVA